RLFPSAERLAELEPAELPMPRARARALIGVCRAIAAGDLDLRPGADPGEARAILLALPGVGDWTASYIAMRALRDPDAFPAADLGIRRALARLGNPDAGRRGRLGPAAVPRRVLPLAMNAPPLDLELGSPHRVEPGVRALPQHPVEERHQPPRGGRVVVRERRPLLVRQQYEPRAHERARP